MALAAFHADAVALPAWTKTDELARFVADPAKVRAGRRSQQPAGRDDQRGPRRAA